MNNESTPNIWSAFCFTDTTIINYSLLNYPLFKLYCDLKITQ
jgi:hypothetical protein